MDIVVDTLLDLLKLLPFLFISFLIIELIEHKFNDKSKSFITKSGKFGPLIGGGLGVIPQCGFSSVATNLYVTRIISLGTLISIYLSTSDEMIPILISNNVNIKTILIILGIKVLIAVTSGFVIDFSLRKKNDNNFKICDDEECDCNESIFKSSLKHTFKCASFILIITFILNTLFYFVDENVIGNIFMNNKILAPIISSIIGLIPNCASSIMISELFLNNMISVGSMIAGLLTNAGVSLIILFKTNKDIKENLGIVLLIYLIGIISGIILNLVNFSI